MSDDIEIVRGSGNVFRDFVYHTGTVIGAGKG